MAVAADAVAIFCGFMIAVWIRFDSGWLEVPRGIPPRHLYLYAAGVVTLLFLFIFRSLGLYERPQYGHYIDRIPRIVRACGLGILLATALAFAIQIDPPFSRLATGLALITVTLLVILERTHPLPAGAALGQAPGGPAQDSPAGHRPGGGAAAGRFRRGAASARPGIRLPPAAGRNPRSLPAPGPDLLPGRAADPAGRA